MNEPTYIHWLPTLDEVTWQKSAKTSSQLLTDWGVPGVVGFVTTARAWHEASDSEGGMTEALASALTQGYAALSQEGLATVTACEGHHRLELGKSDAEEMLDSQSLIDFCRRVFHRGSESQVVLVARQWVRPALVGVVSSADQAGLGLMTVEARRSDQPGHGRHERYAVFKRLLGATRRTPIVQSVAAEDGSAAKRMGSRFMLDADEVLTLARWAARIEKRVGKAVRMEWMRGAEAGALYVLAVRSLPWDAVKRRTAGKGESFERTVCGGSSEENVIGMGAGWARIDDVLGRTEDHLTEQTINGSRLQAREALIQSIAQAAARVGVLAYPNEAVVAIGRGDQGKQASQREAMGVMCQGIFRARTEMGLENLAVGLDVGNEVDAIGDGLRTMARHGLIRGEAELRVYLRWRRGLEIETMSRFCDGLVIYEHPLPDMAEISSVIAAVKTAGLKVGVCVGKKDLTPVALLREAGATWVAREG